MARKGLFRRVLEAVGDFFSPQSLEPPEEIDEQPPGIGEIPDTGDYPASWGAPEIRFWRRLGYHDRRYYSSDEQYHEYQDMFDEAFIEEGLTKSYRDESRRRYFEATQLPASAFPWAYFREYIRAAGTPK